MRRRAPLPSPVRALVIGYGSIGRRHARLLERMGCEGAVGSRRPHVLARRLEGEAIVSAEVRTASWLPGWRPGRDYRATYSASRALGGGVLRDMSHELDYPSWLFGPWRRLTALGGHLSPLEIESDDCW